MRPVAVDFETEGIEERPEYPPRPVGLAILDPEGEWAPDYGMYITDMEVAKRYLKTLYQSNREMLFHHAKFDTEVAQKHFELPIPDWKKVHDTLFEIFLYDPYARSFSLKPSAERILKLPPDEQQAVRQWLVENKYATATQKDWGKFISIAPRPLTGKYAIGDVYRTWKLHEKLHSSFDEGMSDAYNRERQLMSILMKNEQRGMRVDVNKLKAHVVMYHDVLVKADAWIRWRLGAPTLNVDSDAEVAQALKKAGVVRAFVKTKTGKDSVSKKNLTIGMYADRMELTDEEKKTYIHSPVQEALGYRNRLSTALSMSMIPWLEMAEKNNGYIYTTWNQVRQAHGEDKSKGTKTARLSCSRFQNITKDWYDKGDYVYPKWLGVPDLPLVRSYILGDEGQWFGHRDYNQQEWRIVAHFEEGRLAAEYIAHPPKRDGPDDKGLDVHDHLKNLVLELTGHDYARRVIKVLNFGDLYGMGKAKKAAGMQTDAATVARLDAIKRKAMPDVAKLIKDVQARARAGQPVREWGGGLIHCEPPMMREGRWWSFEYKVFNYLIQRSAASCTKQAIIDYDAAKKDGRFLVSVHDENNISCSPDKMKSELKILRDVMMHVKSAQGEFSVPMYSDPKMGETWGSIKKFEEED